MLTTIKRWILNPPKYMEKEKDRLRANISQDWREILVIDFIIVSFLLASIHQLAFVFGRGVITLVPVLKAIGIDGSIWILSRAVSKRLFAGRGNKLTQVFLWIGILIFVILTTIVNTLYELWDRSVPVGYVDFVIDSDILILFTKSVGSMFLAVIILFLTFVRAILHKNMEKSIVDITGGK